MRSLRTPSTGHLSGAVRAGVALALLLLAAAPLAGGPALPPRVATGVRLFRTLLAADQQLEARKDAEGRLLVLVVYSSDASAADAVAAQLAAPGENQAVASVKGMPLTVEVTSDPSFAAYETRKPAAVFVADALREEALGRVVAYGIASGVIVYSPLEGHVEKGVLGGIAVEARVQPYLNQTTLTASRVSLTPFFLKVSKITK